MQSVLGAPAVAGGAPCSGRGVGKVPVGAMEMTEAVRARYPELHFDAVLACGEVAEAHLIRRKRAGRRLAAVDAAFVHRRAVLRQAQLQLAAGRRDVEEIADAAAVKGQSLRRDRLKAEGLGQFFDPRMRAGGAHAEITEQI